MADPFNLVPDNCMVIILASMPLVDTIRISQVSQRWMFIHEAICDNVTSLNIRGSHNFSPESTEKLRLFNLKDNRFDLVDVKSSRNKSAKFWKNLVAKFPNVKQLSLFECTISDSQLEDLLKSKWSQKLTQLKLISQKGKSWSENSIWPLVNEMPKLEHFSLNNDGMESFSVPRQIEEFAYSLENFPDDILLTLKRFDVETQTSNAACKLKKFGIMITELSEDYQEENDEDLAPAFDQLFNQNLPYVHMLTRLAILEFSIDLSLLQLICAKFPSIEYFDFNLEHPALFEEPIWAALSQLKRLTDLGIKADENYQLPVIPIEIDNEHLPRFESLTKCVRLLNCHRIHPHQYSRLEAMFPNCERITIQFSPRYFFDQDERYRQMKLCYFCATCIKLRKTLPPNKFCIKLYNQLLILLDIKRGAIHNVAVQIDEN